MTARRALAACAAAWSGIDLRDGFVFGGLACVVIGVALIYTPAAWIIGGAALFWLGLRKT